MIRTKHEYIEKLSQLLPDTVDKQEILAEYINHIADMERELVMDDEERITTIISVLGSPEEIAVVWHQEDVKKPTWTMWGFFCVNLVFFIFGSALTAVHHLYNFQLIDRIWTSLAGEPYTLLIIYSFFWIIVGFEVGREYGHGGRHVILRLFCFLLVPNLLLMFGHIFQYYPISWFEPLLQPTFSLLCILFTCVFFPINCWIGFKAGKRLSI